ncbi:P2 response regulator binding domain-containing protein [Tindallia magadiensis]|uniref:P2 response regulator binding domain-containing protein n=2 Tax=Tindallia magadiensis TaxID=69895 RepID=A0A1I3G9A3_9FIRM|nr:P2 response regulator binding domain-containing protein [Tindallia magadiensis]
MDSMVMVYFEETFEQLDQCEQCLQHLEKGYSEEYVNQFFRYAHSIKGSSDAMGYEEVKDLTHQLEDIWSLIRSKKLSISKDILDISYQAVDIIYQMVENRKNPATEADLVTQLIEKSKILKKEISALETQKATKEPIKQKKDEKEEKDEAEKEEIASKEVIYENKMEEQTLSYPNQYFIQIIMEPENPMPAVTQFLILKSLEENGVIDYAKPSLEKIRNMDEENHDFEMEFILQTGLNRNELHKEIEIGYIKDFVIIDLKEAYQKHVLTLSDKDFFDYFFREISRVIQLINEKQKEALDPSFWKTVEFVIIKIHSKSILLENDFYYDQLKDHLDIIKDLVNMKQKDDIVDPMDHETLFFILQKMFLQLLQEVYRMIKNEIIIRYMEVKEGQNMILTFQNITLEMEPDRYKILLIDISLLSKLREDEMQSLEAIYQKLKDMGISMFLVHDGKKNKRVYTGQRFFTPMQHIIRYQNEKEMIRKILIAWKTGEEEVKEVEKAEEANNENIDC